MFFAFFALITAFPLDVPKYSLMVIYPSADTGSLEQLKNSLDTTKSEKLEECLKVPEDNFDKYFMCQVVINYQELLFSYTLNDFSNLLSEVSSQSKLLFIFSELTTDYTIDLRNIRSKIDVEIACGKLGTNLKILDDSNLTSHRILNSLKKLTNNKFPLPFQSSNLKNPKVTGVKLGLVGDIKDKVGSLSLSTNFQEFEITESDLEIDSFSLVFNADYDPNNLSPIVISTNSRNIQTTNLYVDPAFHMAFSTFAKTGFVNAHSYFLHIPRKYTDYFSLFQIGFNNDQWQIQCKTKDGVWDTVFTDDRGNHISYTKAKMFGILSTITNFELNTISTNLPQGKSASIRYLDELPSDAFIYLIDTQELPFSITFPTLISISTSGVWFSVSKDRLPTVYLTYPQTDTHETRTEISNELDSLVVINPQSPQEQECLQLCEIYESKLDIPSSYSNCSDVCADTTFTECLFNKCIGDHFEPKCLIQ